ncbi:MAG TPA: DNA mismatch repair endonuclease MutL [bacterium]|nr:DNA mismatch repair endonuclease MutL [bacterium]HPS29148.1 DNA mismatch repair endonuclease MutL [bacterium]
MGKITLLSERTINQIAAGEVVERPQSIIKELIENSIDAGADSISIDILNGGKLKIAVKDNGCGMSEEDLFMSLERHATSKISSIEELTSLSTMGFRGEAIPSIAAVTHFSISSATEHGSGFSIQLKNGKITGNRPVSMPKGTEIVAADLFHNVPARKKFLKSDDRESALIRELVQKFAITNPHIGFSLDHNGKNIFTYRKDATVVERISSVWKINPERFSRSFVSTDEATVEAFVPTPFEQVPAISVVSVNNRIVTDRQINSAIFKTFREIIGGDFKSPVVLFLKTVPGFTDINVHPSKLEVRFVKPSLIFELIGNSIAEALNSFRSNTGTENEFKYDSLRTAGNILSSQPSFVAENQNIFEYGKETAESNSENDPSYSYKFRDYKKIGIVFGVYQIIETKDSVIFLDLHASHERITFTKLTGIISLKNGLSQVLTAPQIIKVSPSELAEFNEHTALFNENGFSIENFDENSLIMRSVPALGFDTDWNGTVKEILGQMINEGSTDILNEKFLYFIASIACRSSVKRNDHLSDIEIDFLINDINNSTVLTCPHGRPFFFVISRNEFEKRVQRR